MFCGASGCTMFRAESQVTGAQQNEDSNRSVASLVIGVLGDMRQLVVQEVALAKDELLEKIIAMKQVAILLGAALVILATAAILLMVMLVHLLRAISDLPLWGCYGIVGGTLAACGWALLATAKRRLRNISVAPTQTIETVKETTLWLGKQAESLKM